MNKRDLRFLLKDKYNLPEGDIAQFLRGVSLTNKTLARNIASDIRALKRGYPLAYVIGWTEFLGCKIDLRYKPLIPRPETEYWVNESINIIKSQKRNNIKALDIFCGSGCIGIAISKAFPTAHVTLSDISYGAVEQTKFNLKLNGIEKYRYKVIKANLFEGIRSKFDVIFANPPYIGKNDPFDKNIKYEPREALFVNGNVVDFVVSVILQGCGFLRKDGALYMEIPSLHATEIVSSVQSRSDKVKIRANTDQFGRLRWVEVALSTS